MMQDWNGHQKEIGGRLGELPRFSPEMMEGLMALSAANAEATALGEKTRKLISPAVAVTTRCNGGIVFHADAALNAGAGKEEISEGWGVEAAMNAEAALDAVEAKNAGNAR